MRFVESFTPPDFEAKSFTPPTSPNLNSFSDKNKKIIENGEIYTAGENFTLPPAVSDGRDKSHPAPPPPPPLQLQRNNTILFWLGKQTNIKHNFKILLPICEYMPY